MPHVAIFQATVAAIFSLWTFDALIGQCHFVHMHTKSDVLELTSAQFFYFIDITFGKYFFYIYELILNQWR